MVKTKNDLSEAIRTRAVRRTCRRNADREQRYGRSLENIGD